MCDNFFENRICHEFLFNFFPHNLKNEIILNDILKGHLNIVIFGCSLLMDNTI
jgi:hypothetical protein